MKKLTISIPKKLRKEIKNLEKKEGKINWEEIAIAALYQEISERKIVKIVNSHKVITKTDEIELEHEVTKILEENIPAKK